MPTTTETLTLAQLERRLLDAPDDGHQYKIVHNDLVVVPPAARNGSGLAAWLDTLLGPTITTRRLGTLGARMPTAPDQMELSVEPVTMALYAIRRHAP